MSKYTRQQIQDFCKTAEHTAQYNRMPSLVEALKIIKQLQAQLTTANKQILEYEQTEAAVCPEDVGIKEYVESLLNKLATAKAENEDLCDNIEAVRQERADYLDGTLEGKLRGELEAADKQIGWIKDDKVELNRAIKLRDNAFDALIDMNEKESKQLQAELDKANDENKRLREELHEIEAVACGETQIESDGVYDDGDGMKWIYDKIQALKEKP